jgi:glyoxylase-like metal-dependent hydrolase (beta-lactamase superfamily II)
VTAPTVFLQQVFAGPMGNCLYLLGDQDSKEAFVVDPAFEPLGLVEVAETAGFTVVGVLATHVHPDHVGGDLMGFAIPGVRELLAERDLPIHIHAVEADRLELQTGTPKSNVRRYRDGDVFALGELRIRVLHTPGHSPGSSCFLVGRHLIAGDTLFVQGCGRIDLPGSDPDAMFRSLRRLAELPPETQVYPGHNYGPRPTSTIGDELRHNAYLRVESAEQWRRMMGGG